MRSDLPQLSHLFTAYFHEDVSVDGDWPEAVDRFAGRNPHRVAGAVEEAERLLARSDLSDEEIDALMEECGSAYDVARGQARALLEAICDRLRDRPAEQS